MKTGLYNVPSHLNTISIGHSPVCGLYFTIDHLSIASGVLTINLIVLRLFLCDLAFQSSITDSNQNIRRLLNIMLWVNIICSVSRRTKPSSNKGFWLCWRPFKKLLALTLFFVKEMIKSWGYFVI